MSNNKSTFYLVFINHAVTETQKAVVDNAITVIKLPGGFFWKHWMAQAQFVKISYIL